MLRKQKRFGKEKHQFRSHYCSECKQVRPCGNLTQHTGYQKYCCSCYYQQAREKAQEYTNYQQVYQQKFQGRQKSIQQLKLLREYSGCKNCGSKEVDAYELYENNQLVCQSCLVRKTGSSTSPVSFPKQQKWYKKHWGINLAEWLDKYQCLPVNVDCAKKWLKDKEHLNNCACLEQETKEVCELFTNSLKEKQEKLTKCSCKSSKKTRVDSDYYAYCEKCEKTIAVASKKRVIKNRNNPSFWGLNVQEKVLCGECLETRKKDMKPLKRAEFNRYRKKGRL